MVESLHRLGPDTMQTCSAVHGPKYVDYHVALLDLAETVVMSVEMSLAKLRGRTPEIPATRVGVKHNRTVLADDVVKNVQGARAISMVGVRFQRSRQAIKQIRASCNWAHHQNV